MDNQPNPPASEYHHRHHFPKKRNISSQKKAIQSFSILERTGVPYPDYLHPNNAEQIVDLQDQQEDCVSDGADGRGEGSL